MTNPTSPDKNAMPKGPRISPIILALAIVVSLFCCGLMLLVPTRSLATNPVYKGF